MAGAVRNITQLPGAGIDEDAPVVALTFDDGPRPPGTPAALDALRAADVCATFFVVGDQIAKHPELLRTMADDGHTIGLHGWDHVRFTELDDGALGADLDRSGDAVAGIIGTRPTLVRPPYGRIDERVEVVVRARGLVPVNWDVDPEDWRCPDVTTLSSRVLADTGPGSIVLLHDGIRDPDATIAALPTIVAGLQGAGYQLVAL